MTPALTPESRTQLLDELETTRFDVIVIGGGIAGAGIAREAAARGLRVALCEADDFGVGTSSRSSKMIHGGLRYLAQGRLGFVRRTARERNAVHAMAPHLARSCWMVAPARHWMQAQGFRCALAVYERLGGVKRDDTHISWDGAELAMREPSLRGDAYGRAVAFREYLTDDVRLVLAVLRAAAESGAVLSSRTPVRGLLRQGTLVSGVVVQCPLTGREVKVRGSAVVNAAGPWVDCLAELEVQPPAAQVVVSKGVHLVVDRSRLPVEHPILCMASDRRWIFAIPRRDIVYIGTTDTAFDGERAVWPPIDCADVRYLLEALGGYFTTEPLRPDDVLAAWAGLRALPARGVRKSIRMSREAELRVGPGMLLSVSGGKLTGFAGLAASTVDLVGRLGEFDLAPGPGTTPLPGAALEPAADDERLHQLYGADATNIISLGGGSLVEGAPVLTGEVDWAVNVEAATAVEDVVYRRTLDAWHLPRHRLNLAEAIADRMASLLSWNDHQRQEQVSAVKRRFAAELTFSGFDQNDT